MSTPTEAATDPLTPASTLALLAAAPEAAVRRLVAANPATPAEALRQLALSFPDEVLDNPALPLHLLEDPAFFSRLDLRTCQALLGSPRATPELCEQLAQHPLDQVRMAVARASVTPMAVLEQLARSSTHYLVAAVAYNPRLSLASLHALLLHPHEAVVLAILGTGRVGSEWLAALVDSPHTTLRAYLAARTADAVMLARLARDPELVVRRAVVRNPHATEAVIRRLCRDSSEEIRREVVGHPSTGRFTNLTLLRDPARPARRAARAKLQALWQPA